LPFSHRIDASGIMVSKIWPIERSIPAIAGSCSTASSRLIAQQLGPIGIFIEFEQDLNLLVGGVKVQIDLGPDPRDGVPYRIILSTSDNTEIWRVSTWKNERYGSALPLIFLSKGCVAEVRAKRVRAPFVPSLPVEVPFRLMMDFV